MSKFSAKHHKQQISFIIKRKNRESYIVKTLDLIRRIFKNHGLFFSKQLMDACKIFDYLVGVTFSSLLPSISSQALALRKTKILSFKFDVKKRC